MKVVFVVLHYENIKDTKECLDSLLKYIKNDNVDVIVIDNGSKKERLKIIESQYYKIKNIHFIYSNFNLGFAKGNNIGYIYAKKKLSADIIIIANNDLIFEQDDFVKNIINHSTNSSFDIAGPKIISIIDGKNQNPVPVQFKNIKDLNVRIVKYIILYILCIFGIDCYVQKIISKPIQEFFPENKADFQLHGACIFFANRYIAEQNGFYDKTFMYNEEGILKELAIKNKMKMLYFDDIEVKHKEGASTKAIYGKGRKKRLFYYKWNIHSCFLLRRIKINLEEL